MSTEAGLYIFPGLFYPLLMKLRIQGPSRLSGELTVSGAKNSALPAMAASLLTDSLVLSNVPEVQDILSMGELLMGMGKTGRHEGDHWVLEGSRLHSCEASYELVKKMRASILVLGPLLARYGEVKVAYPGGCNIGARPVDLHIEGLKKMGAKIDVEHGTIHATARRLQGTEIHFDKVTVTGTENLLMAATLAQGTTVINNAAREPEVTDLVRLLKKMGARIGGEGSDTLVVEGVESLGPAEHRIIPDRIEGGTFFVLGALCADELVVRNLEPLHLKSLLSKAGEAGVSFTQEADLIRVKRCLSLKPLDLETQPYPGFPTDMQAQFMVLLTQAEGRSLIRETIFPGRYHHVDELLRLGASLKKRENGEVMVSGPTPLSGAEVTATDLRASACLVIAGLLASGVSVVNDIHHLERGYERLVDKIRSVGGDVGYLL